MEFWVLASLYNEPKKSALFPMNDGLIARLEGKRYIAKFTQPVDVTMKLNYYMQPFVEWAFDYIIKKYERQNNSLKSRIEKRKDNKKIIYLQRELNDNQQFLYDLKTVSINQYYDQSSIL